MPWGQKGDIGQVAQTGQKQDKPDIHDGRIRAKGLTKGSKGSSSEQETGQFRLRRSSTLGPGMFCMDKNRFKELLHACMQRCYGDGAWSWTKEELARTIKFNKEDIRVSDPYVQKVLKELEGEGYIKLFYRDDVYLPILDPMKRPHRVDGPAIKDIVLAGFGRFFHEGMRYWTREEFHGLINPRGYQYKLSDPAIQKMLKELEAEGYIRLLGEKQRFLEVLKVE